MSIFSRKSIFVCGLMLFLLGFFHVSGIQAQTEPAHKKGTEAVQTQKKSGDLDSIKESWLKEIRTRSEKNPDSSSTSPVPQKAIQEKAAENLPSQNPKESLRDIPKQAGGTLEEQVNEEAAPSFFSAALRLAGLLFIFAFVFYFGVRLFRFRKKGPFRRGDEIVQVLANIPLLQGKFLQIVDVAGQLLVLGVSDAGVQLLTSIHDGAAADRIRLWQSRQSPQSHEIESAPLLMDRLTALLKGTDFHFWSSSKLSSKKNFKTTLKEFTGTGSSGASEFDSEDIKRLLREQKRNLTKTEDKTDKTNMTNETSEA